MDHYISSLARRKEGICLFLVTALLYLVSAGCSSPHPTTLGEDVSGYTYIPVDPTKVQIEARDCTISYSEIGNDTTKSKVRLLDILPDNAVRMSMELANSQGNVVYGVSKVGATGSSYRLTADYVNSDTVNKSVWISRSMLIKNTENVYVKGMIGGYTLSSSESNLERQPVAFGREVYANQKKSAPDQEKELQREMVPGSEVYEVKSFSDALSTNERKELTANGFQEFNVPIYVGIGLRIVAEGKALSADANISGIGVIGAEAEANRLVGSLTVQTLGINSQSVASALPVQSELNRITAENAFVAIGSIKAMLHQAETIKFPRVVGLYLPFPGGKPLVNALISELSRNPVTWCPGGFSNQDQPHVPVKGKEKPADVSRLDARPF